MSLDTAAQWVAEPDDFEPNDWFLKDPSLEADKSTIAIVTMTGDEDYDDEVIVPRLQLMKTAPKLLSACRKVKEALDEFELDETMQEALDVINRAIREAESA